jgi:hypothetical protein
MVGTDLVLVECVDTLDPIRDLPWGGVRSELLTAYGPQGVAGPSYHTRGGCIGAAVGNWRLLYVGPAFLGLGNRGEHGEQRNHRRRPYEHLEAPLKH